MSATFALSTALHRNNVTEVAKLLESGVDAGSWTTVPHIVRAATHCPKSIPLLLQHGASLWDTDLLGRTAFHRAVMGHHYTAVETLIREARRPQLRLCAFFLSSDHLPSALHWALRCQIIRTVSTWETVKRCFQVEDKVLWRCVCEYVNTRQMCRTLNVCGIVAKTPALRQRLLTSQHGNTQQLWRKVLAKSKTNT